MLVMRIRSTALASVQCLMDMVRRVACAVFGFALRHSAANALNRSIVFNCEAGGWQCSEFVQKYLVPKLAQYLLKADDRNNKVFSSTFDGSLQRC